jgi:hypothetical protein
VDRHAGSRRRGQAMNPRRTAPGQVGQVAGGFGSEHGHVMDMASKVRDRTESGDWDQGARLPRLDDFAAEYDANRDTIGRAIDVLKTRRRRVGHPRAKVGDRVLLCSDGLSSYASRALIHPSKSPEIAVERLAALALDQGGVDNITVLFINIAPGQKSSLGSYSSP